MPIFRRPVNQSFVVPETIYVSQVIAAETRIAQTSGNTYHRLRLVLWPGSHRITTRLVFTQKSGWVIADFCSSAGLILPEGVDDFDLRSDDCVGRICYVSTKDRESSQGNTFSDVHRFLTRDKALKNNPELAKVSLPKNMPPAKQLAAGSTRLPDDLSALQSSSETLPEAGG